MMLAKTNTPPSPVGSQKPNSLEASSLLIKRKFVFIPIYFVTFVSFVRRVLLLSISGTMAIGEETMAEGFFMNGECGTI